MRIALLAALLCTLGCPATATFEYQDVTIDASALVNATAVGAGDVFEVRVHQHVDLTGIYRVSPEGDIDFPLIGRTSVKGLSPSQIAATIQQRLQDGYLRHPYVTVYIKEFNSKKVFVLGQVQKPGTFTFEESMNIVQAIALAGGFSPLAEKNFAIVRRVDNGVEKRIPVPVEKIITDKDATNFLLKPGDIIFVPEAVL